MKLLPLFSVIVFFIFAGTAHANQFVFKHLDCKVRFNKTENFMNKLAQKKLSEKGYITYSFNQNNRMNVGDLYFKLAFTRDPGKLWKDCIVTTELRKAKNQRVLSKDKILFSRTVRRSLPRHTFSGDERCTRGLKDTFINIPHCKRMTVSEKTQGH